MSYTEIFAFKNGKSKLAEEVNNAFRGAMAIWGEMEKQHLSPIYASWDATKQISRASSMDQGKMKEIWNMASDKNIPLDERLVLSTTFDKVLVKRENLPRLIEAFKNFENTYKEKTSLPEQTSILEAFLDDEDVMAVGWNQTSVNGDNWNNFGGYDEDEGEPIPYDINSMSEHWFLFDDFKDEIN